MHGNPFIGFVLMLVASSTFLSRLAFADDVAQSVEANLIAKGDGYLVHVSPLQGSATKSSELKKHFGVPMDNVALTHTSTKTGKMKYLFISGRHTTVAIMGTPSYHLEWRLLGVSVSNDRIFLATWRSDVRSKWQGEGIRQRRVRVNEKGKYEVSVFNVKDGEKLSSISLPVAHMPPYQPAKLYDNGWLRVNGDEILIHKQKFRFDGKQLRPAQ